MHIFLIMLNPQQLKSFDIPLMFIHNFNEGENYTHPMVTENPSMPNIFDFLKIFF